MAILSDREAAARAEMRKRLLDNRWIALAIRMILGA
jgi:hypothetical protein